MRRQHRFHGDSKRFFVVADFIYQTYGTKVKYIADIAGGQGYLSRLLNKRFNYEAQVVDPRGWVMKGIQNRPEDFRADMADYYDLIVGLHPDQAILEVAKAALIKPTVLIPCCNFWSEEKLGRDELLAAIENYYHRNSVSFKRFALNFKGPHNYAIVSAPTSLNEGGS